MTIIEMINQCRPGVAFKNELLVLLRRLVLIQGQDVSTPCWVYPDGRSGRGVDKFGGKYGIIRFSGKQEYVHRILYRCIVGDIEKGFELDHLCKRRSCANPFHLEPVTHQENCMRGARKSSVKNCPSGHPYSGDNLYVKPDGRRVCRICRRNQKRMKRILKKEAHERTQSRTAGDPPTSQSGQDHYDGSERQKPQALGEEATERGSGVP